MATESVQVLSRWLSFFGFRVLVALKHKGIPYDYLEQDLSTKSQLLLQSNPIHKKIPVLIHDGKPICESLIIVQYIDEVWPSSDKPLLPKDPFERATAWFWADYIDKKMYDAGVRIVSSQAQEDREQAKKGMVEVLETLDGALAGVCKGGPYFGGQDLGFVDVALAPFLCFFQVYEAFGEFKIWEDSKCPHLQKWAETVVEYPSMKEAMSIAPAAKIADAIQSFRKESLAK